MLEADHRDSIPKLSISWPLVPSGNGFATPSLVFPRVCLHSRHSETTWYLKGKTPRLWGLLLDAVSEILIASDLTPVQATPIIGYFQIAGGL